MIGGVRWVVLFCRDADACRDWYQAVGFELLNSHEGMHFFRLGDGQLLLHPAEESGGGQAEIHLNVADVHELFARVRKLGGPIYDHQNPGVELTEPVTYPWGDVSFETRDPEGHYWAFTQQ